MLLEPAKRSAAARAALADAGNEVYLSVASIWELAIKHAAGKLVVSEPPEQLAARATVDLRLRVLPIHAAHAFAAASLPMHHKDPFDRMLVAQARCEQLTRSPPRTRPSGPTP